jgi:hypothetical protein
MKKCTYCGKEFSDEVTVCPQDGQPVVSSPGSAPPPMPAGKRAQSAAPASGLAITSMVLGILSLVLCVIGPLFGIPAVICGHIARDRIKKAPLQNGGDGFATAGMITGYISLAMLLVLPILAGLLLPALAKAKEKAMQIQCASNLKQVGLAARIWSGDHNDVLPNNFLEMSNELSNPVILICPADSRHTRPAGGTQAIWDPANVTYEFLTPGMPQDKVTNQVIVRCPIHGNEVWGDGSVHIGKTKRQVQPVSTGP